MLRNFYIMCLVLLIGVGNALIMQQVPNENQNRRPSVLGIIDISKIISNNDQKMPISGKIKSKLELTASQTKQINSVEINLQGQGCTSNVAPNTCKLVNNQKSGVILKNCSDETWDQCNFYTYELGKQEEDIQYILQNYSENSDRLVDILEYNTKTNTFKQIKTVLYQDTSDKNNDIVESNNNFTATIEQYKK
ncbi:MAG: hypothetical protein H7196_00545 [candidate division SR1 bacterium]|nr:hypothetical protein [candidate division SR1 bacterium]